MQPKVQAILSKHMKGDMVNLCLEPVGTIEKGRCRSESSKDDEEQEPQDMQSCKGGTVGGCDTKDKERDE